MAHKRQTWGANSYLGIIHDAHSLMSFAFFGWCPHAHILHVMVVIYSGFNNLYTGTMVKKLLLQIHIIVRQVPRYVHGYIGGRYIHVHACSRSYMGVEVDIHV